MAKEESILTFLNKSISHTLVREALISGLICEIKTFEECKSYFFLKYLLFPTENGGK